MTRYALNSYLKGLQKAIEIFFIDYGKLQRVRGIVINTFFINL